MTKQEKAMFEEMFNTVKALNDRIAKLEGGMSSRTETVDSKESKKSANPVEISVGNLIFNGKTVRTGSNYMTSKTRFAISKSVEEFGGSKLSRDNEIVKKFAKKDKYVQVYEFKTIADCEKFMKAQQSRVSK
jgi:3-phenylpropionate/cinnamic acid dioxygenase small subunit